MRALWGCAIAFVATGCGQIFGFQQPVLNDGLGGDGSNFTPQCFGAPASWSACITQMPTAITLPNSIDTGGDNSPMGCTGGATWASTASGQPSSACFVAGTDVTINTTSVHDFHALVVVATGTITITGTLSFAGNNNGDSGGGGGAGGSLAYAGAGGGNGNGVTSGGGAAAAFVPQTLVGGCGGQAAGGASGINNTGNGGAAGHAIYLVAGQSISLAGTAVINVSGAGGFGGAMTHDGGGRRRGAGGASRLLRTTAGHA